MVELTAFRRDGIKRRLTALEIAEDTIDINALWDSKLNYMENIKVIENTIGKELKLGSEEDSIRAEKEYLSYMDEQARKEVVLQVVKAENLAIEKLKTIENSTLDGHFRIADNMVDSVIKGYANSLLLLGEGGIGKTFRVMKRLAVNNLKSGDDYVFLNTYTTPLEFYNFLYENNQKLIVLDDVEGLLKDDKGQAILKSALWSATDERILTYMSNSDKLVAPKKFVFSGRIIFCVNDLNGDNNRSFQALLSRMLFHEVSFSYFDKLKILLEIAKQTQFRDLSEAERLEVFDYIKSITSEASADLNIRTLIKAFSVYSFAKKEKVDWKEIVQGMMRIDEDLETVREMIGIHSTAKDQAKAFAEHTGKSRATFFRLKSKITKSLKVSSVSSS